MSIVTRDELAEVLEHWRDGRLAMPEVYLWAEERYAVSRFQPADDAVNEILAILDMLKVDPLSTEDARVLRELLDRAGTNGDQARTRGTRIE